MAAEQGHGTEFERIVVERSGLQLAPDRQTGPTSLNDIPMEGTRDAVPISVKVSQWPIGHTATRPVLAMGDARRFFEASTGAALRMVAGLHHPTPEGPLVYEIHTCLLTPTMHAGLWGDLTAEDIQVFTRSIQDWAKEDDRDGVAGRKRASEKALAAKRRLLTRIGHVDLSPKISAQEARLQCAIPLHTLRRECLNAGNEATYASVLEGDTQWMGIALPLQLNPGKRTGQP
jgi:hypothetical protein